MARMEGTKEVLLSWLYDHDYLVAGATYSNRTFFQVPHGQTIPGTAIAKTYRHTNLNTSSFMGSINTFTITAFYIAPPAFMNSVDVDGFINGHGVFWINDKYYPDYFTINMFIGGSQWRESVRGPAAGPDYRAFTGDGRSDNIVQFKRPYLVTIDSFENFRAELNWVAPGFTPTESYYIGWILYGRKERAVA